MMKLKKLKVRQFKGVRSFDFKPNGGSVSIRGMNASGKTTIADAVSWLLFDKDTRNRSADSFGLKTLDENGEPLHGEEHWVEASFSLEDGTSLTLKKVYQEKWRKPRGSNESVLDGHTTDYYWDEEPVSKGEYTNRLEKIMPEQLFKMLSLPAYFAEEMHWTERRKILIQLCGEIRPEEVIENNLELARYAELVEEKEQSAVVKILREKKGKLSKELDNIPDRIDENQQKISVPDISRNEAEYSLAEAEDEINILKDKISEIQAGGGVSHLQAKIDSLKAERSEAETKHREAQEDELADLREAVQQKQSELDEINSKHRHVKERYRRQEDVVEELDQKAEKINDKIELEQASSPKPKPESKPDLDECPMCGQPMPDDGDDHDPDAEYEAYLQEFNQKRAETIKSYKKDLQAVEDELDDEQSKLDDLRDSLEGFENLLKEKLAEAEQIEKQLEQAKANRPAFDSSEYDVKIEAIEQKINEYKNDRESLADEVRVEIEQKKAKVDELREVIHQHDNNRMFTERIKELKELQKKYGSDLSQVEKDLWTIEQYNRAEAEMITEKVNERFRLVDWRLFKEQVNGGITETCDPVVGGVPYSEGLNNAARIQAGLDIIETLSKHYDKQVPVWIDNRESVTRLPETDLQVISLIVDPNFGNLTVEQDETEMVTVNGHQ